MSQVPTPVILTQADFTDMRKAGEQFQNALEDCERTQTQIETAKQQLATGYGGDAGSSSQTFFAKLAVWQGDFNLVKGALARMVLELADATTDYQKNEHLNEEIANAIAAQLD
jgi:hypothetical protein